MAPMTTIDELPLSTSAYLSDTGHLTTLEHGAYLLLLIAMRRSQSGWLPNSDQYLARATRMTLGRWKRIAPTIRAMLVVDGDQVSQKRILRERQDSDQDSKSIPSKNQNRPANSLKTNTPASNIPNAPTLLRESNNSTVEKKESESGANLKRGRYRRGPRSIIPKDWTPSEHGLLYASAKGFDAVKISQIARACLLYHRKHGTLIADLEATWESWVDREIQFNAEREKRNGSGPSMFEIAAGNLKGAVYEH
jgi:uncharacterized protein YdaU (DUF1376 family)